MKKNKINHAERRAAAVPEAFRPQPKVKPIKDEPKPVKNMQKQTFSRAEIERLKAKAASKSTPPAAKARVYEVLNLEAGMPSGDAAVKKAEVYLTGAKARGIKAVKLIHGWGSSGNGGHIRTLLREKLSVMSCVKCFVCGEEFSWFFTVSWGIVLKV